MTDTEFAVKLGWKFVGGITGWVRPDGIKQIFVPDWPNDIAALYKHAVPVIETMGLSNIVFSYTDKKPVFVKCYLKFWDKLDVHSEYFEIPQKSQALYAACEKALKKE